VIYLGLGSNMGDRANNIKEALNLLQTQQVCIEKTSSVYESSPVGVLDQPNFLNQVVAISTKHSPLRLLDLCLQIEEKLGRVRTYKWGPRTIDIDILLYHNEVISQERLIIPHPYLHERRFVLEPLAEIACDVLVYNCSVKQLLAKLTDEAVVHKIIPTVKIMFITAPIGSGHVRAAQAVEKAVNELALSQQCRVLTVQYSLFDFIPKQLAHLILSSYFWLLSCCPMIYGGMYQWGNQSSLALVGRNLFNKLLAGRMEQTVIEECPDIIVCTHASAGGVVVELIKNKVCNVPLLAVVTDFVVHRLWIYPEVMRYFVAYEGLKQYFVRHAIPENRVSVTGIPVDSAFGEPKNRKLLQQKYKLDSTVPTLLLMGGGQGLLPLVQLVQIINSLPEPVQLIVVAGNNTQAVKQLQKLSLQTNHRLILFGFVDRIAELMAVADVIITKPGGMTVAEALASQLPLIIYHPLPGQEQANTHYLIEAGVAKQVASPAELAQYLGKLFKEQLVASKMKRNLSSPASSNGARQIAREILQILNNSSK
jgi:processive 1,2-diacylglycerol beta-glucosyltransferase